MWLYDPATLAFLEVNDAAWRTTGSRGSSSCPCPSPIFRPVNEVPRLITAVRRARSADPFSGWRHRLKSGAIIDAEITSHALEFNGWPAVLVHRSGRHRQDPRRSRAGRTRRAHHGLSRKWARRSTGRVNSAAASAAARKPWSRPRHIAVVQIWLNHPATARPSSPPAAGDDLDDETLQPPGGRALASWSAIRTLGVMALFARTPLTEGTMVG